MTIRMPVLQEFLTSLASGLATRPLSPPAAAAIDRIFNALTTPFVSGSGNGTTLPVCACLSAALETARSAAPELARIADAFAALEPSLRWTRRATSGPFASSNWPDGHANALIAGPNGLEDRPDLLIGVSLLAPHVRYPDHHHSPEEVYLVLSPGKFRQGDAAWFEPGIGGTLYNEPGITHAMTSEDAPLFAIWCLWADSSSRSMTA